MSRGNRLRAALLLLVLLAFALRMYRLDYQPLRGDESFTIQFSAHPPGWLIPSIANVEPNPPLFYFLLHCWMQLLGQTEFATRYLSLLFGVLCVPLVYLLGKSLGQTSAGALAAFFMAINPFQVWHAQDVRNYTIWPALSMSALIFLVHALQKGGRRYWAGYAGIALLSLYTHYFDLFMLLFQNVLFVIVLLTGWRQSLAFKPSRRRLLCTWSMVQAVLAVSFGPWLVYGSSRILFYTTPTQPPALWEVFLRCLSAFTLGKTVPPQLLTVSLPLLFLLLVAALAHSFEKDRSLGLFLMLYLVVPSVCIFIAAQVRPLFRERYLNVIAPAYYLAFSYGLTTSREYVARLKLAPLVVGITFFVLSDAYSLSNHYWNPTYSKSPDWRALTEQLVVETGPEDVIVLNYPDPTFSYYYDGKAPSFILPRSLLSDDVKAETAEALKLLSERYQRIWFYPLTDAGWDNEGFVETWLSRHGRLLEQRELFGFRWLVYEPVSVRLEDIQNPLALQLGDAISLRGYDLHTGQAEVSGVISVERGSAVRFSLYWVAKEQIDISYTVFIHLVDEGGRIWAQRDSLPQDGDFPTDQWMAGDVIVDHYSIIVPAETPPGDYLLSIGMYDPISHQRLRVSGESAASQADQAVVSLVRVH